MSDDPAFAEQQQEEDELDPYEPITPSLLVKASCMDRLRGRTGVQVSTMRVIGQGIGGTVRHAAVVPNLKLALGHGSMSHWYG